MNSESLARLAARLNDGDGSGAQTPTQTLLLHIVDEYADECRALRQQVHTLRHMVEAATARAEEAENAYVQMARMLRAHTSRRRACRLAGSSLRGRTA